MAEVESSTTPAPHPPPGDSATAAFGLLDTSEARRALEARLEALEVALAAAYGEQGRLQAQAESLIEQRERVQGEVARLGAELARIADEHSRLSRQLAALQATRWWRLGAPLRALRRASSARGKV